MIFWIIIIIVIVVIVKKQKAEQEKINQEYAKRYGTSQNAQTKASSNSYYSNSKVREYRKMEQNHKEHKEPADDVCEDIGYKRCPKCSAMVSKKSETCFLCDYSFTDKKETVQKDS